MLDATIKTQLKAYLERLQQPIELIATLDDSDKAQEVRSLLDDIATLSTKVSVRNDGSDSRKPSFAVTRPGEAPRIAFAGIPMGQTTMANSVSIADTFAQLPQTFGVIFTKDGFPALFSDVSKLPIILLTIFAFSMSDTFDTIGTFIGTGRRTGIFSAEDEKALENGSGFSSKMDKALFADSIATSIGAICGTSNTTTYVESSAGIAAGGRTGLTSVVVAICFALSAFLSPVISAVPSAATAGVLVVVGCMMASSLKEIEWGDISEAIPAFFASVFMAFSYSISYGIAGGFITYCLIKTCKGKAKEVHPVIWIVSLLFILDFVITAIL